MERIDSEERMKSSVCSSDMLSHVPSISSMSDTVFESEIDNPRGITSEGSSCVINSTDGDKMEVNMECSDTGVKKLDKEQCDVIRIDSASAAASVSQQLEDKKTIDKMEENSGCAGSLSDDDKIKPETISGDGQDESVCSSSDQQDIELKIDESKCQPDSMTQNKKLIPETKLEKDVAKTGFSAQTKTDRDKEMDTS